MNMNTKAVLLAKPEAPLSWYLKLFRDFKHAHSAVFSQESQAVQFNISWGIWCGYIENKVQ